MPAYRTRWWRCATARWAGIWRALRPTAARTSARPPAPRGAPPGGAPARGKDKRAPAVSRGGRAWAKAAAEGVAGKLGIRSIDEAALARLRADDSRTLYLFDVRDPAEYAAGHVAGALSAPDRKSVVQGKRVDLGGH